MMLHPTPPNQCPYQVLACYTLWFLRYSRTNFFLPPARMPNYPDTMGENNTLTALKCCGVKSFAMTIVVAGYTPPPKSNQL